MLRREEAVIGPLQTAELAVIAQVVEWCLACGMDAMRFMYVVRALLPGRWGYVFDTEFEAAIGRTMATIKTEGLRPPVVNITDLMDELARRGIFERVEKCSHHRRLAAVVSLRPGISFDDFRMQARERVVAARRAALENDREPQRGPTPTVRLVAPQPAARQQPARRLDVAADRGGLHWTPEEDEILRGNGTPPGRSGQAIASHRTRLGLGPRSKAASDAQTGGEEAEAGRSTRALAVRWEAPALPEAPVGGVEAERSTCVIQLNPPAGEQDAWPSPIVTSRFWEAPDEDLTSFFDPS